MFAFRTISLYALTLIAVCGAAKLPSYISPCKRDAATLTDCATKEARKVLPIILNGDKSLKIPNLNPLKLPQVKIEAGDNLKIVLTDVVLNGFPDHTVEKVDIDFNKQHIHLLLKFPRLQLTSTYEINGQILVLPIRGKGPANITFVGGEYSYNTDFDIVKRAGTEYVHLKDPKLTYTTTRSYFVLDNLFDGDKVLGDQMNKFLDENWADVATDLGPAITDVISTVATTIFNHMFDAVPLPELVPIA